MKRVVLFGTGELAQVVRFYLENDSPHQVAAFTADREYVKGNSYDGLPLVPFDEVAVKYPPADFQMFIALSYKNINKLRAQKYEEAKKKGYRLISYVSTKAVIWPALRAGDNVFIFEQNVIQPFAEI